MTVLLTLPIEFTELLSPLGVGQNAVPSFGDQVSHRGRTNDTAPRRQLGHRSTEA